jgi:methane monooxygenase component A gamma chain
VTRQRKAEPEGAAFRLEPSPYGNKERRAEWQARIAALGGLRQATDLLVEWRAAHAADAVQDQDDLWIEAKLEEKVAVLRFDVMTTGQVRTETLTGERVNEVCAAWRQRADAAADINDVDELEAIVREFRQRYRPPIMPSSPFMRAETELAEVLMKARELDWYGQSVDDLRGSRGVIVHKKGVSP